MCRKTEFQSREQKLSDVIQLLLWEDAPKRGEQPHINNSKMENSPLELESNKRLVCESLLVSTWNPRLCDLMASFFSPLHYSLGYSCEWGAKHLISKMEACSFESSLWQPFAPASHELEPVRPCQMCLLTASRTSADFIRNPWVRSASHGVVFLCRTRRVIKSEPTSFRFLSRRRSCGWRWKSVGNKECSKGGAEMAARRSFVEPRWIEQDCMTPCSDCGMNMSLSDPQQICLWHFGERGLSKGWADPNA